MVALYQILYFILHNGMRRTPLHIMNAQAIHEASKSKTLITSFNHFSVSVSYDELLRYHNDLAKLTVKSSRGNVPLPSQFVPRNFTTAAFDNFDHEECTSSGIGGTHDTVSVLFQDKPIQALRKPKISESPIEYGSIVFNVELLCQELNKFLKPSRKPELPNEFVVSTSLHPMDCALQQNMNMKDMAWSLFRLDHSDTNNETPKLHYNLTQEI